MIRYRFARSAHDDLTDIHDYTRRPWWEQQWLVYNLRLKKCFDKSATDPTRYGQDRDDLD